MIHRNFPARAARAFVVLLTLGLAACNEGTTPTSATSSVSVAVPPAGASTDPTPPGTTPVISGVPSSGTLIVGRPFSFTPTAGSTSGASLAFFLIGAPAFLSVDPATGVVTGTPALVDIGTYPNIRVAATDGSGTVAGPAFTLTVVAELANNGAPPVTGTLSIAGSPITAAVEGVAWSFRPSVTVGANGTAVTFRAANMPSWLSFDATNGTLYGTPPAGSVGVYPNIVVAVDEGQSEAALPAFSLSVSAPKPPSIAGSLPSSASIGVAFSFRPVATDPNGLPLVFKVTGKPAWASFDPRTGTLSGTPTAAAAGTSATISISVSDGIASATLPAATLAVVATNSGMASLSWIPPKQRTDGTTLTNLAGYRIYYGTTRGSYPNSISITNPLLTSYAIDALPAGTYYFVTTAFDAEGNESAYSNAVSKTIS